MKADAVTNLLEQVARGEVSVDDARTALEGVELDEATYESAIDHGVFNQVEPCPLYTSPSPRDATLARMPSSARK